MTLNPSQDPDPFEEGDSGEDEDSDTDAMGINEDDPIDATLVGEPVGEKDDNDVNDEPSESQSDSEKG